MPHDEGHLALRDVPRLRPPGQRSLSSGQAPAHLYGCPEPRCWREHTFVLESHSQEILWSLFFCLFRSLVQPLDPSSIIGSLLQDGLLV